MVTKTGPKPKNPMPGGPFGRPEGAPGGARGPVPLRFGPLRFRRPFRPIRQFLEFFPGALLGPPCGENTHKTNGFLTFLVPTRAPKGPPKDPPWLPRASSGPPRGPKKNVFWCARAPWDPVGAPGEPKRADSEDTGRPIQVGHLNSVFCYTSPVILTTFQKKCCGPCGKLTNFFEKRT